MLDCFFKDDVIKCLESMFLSFRLVYIIIFFNKIDICLLILIIRVVVIRNQKNRLDFDISCGFLDIDYMNLIGILRVDFDDVVLYVQLIRVIKNCSIRICIVFLLVKLRIGFFNRMLLILFNIEKCGVRRVIILVRRELIEIFILKYVGFGYILREQIIQDYIRFFVQELFGNGMYNLVILVVDGIYVFI